MYLVGLLDIAHLEVKTAKGGQQGGPLLLHLNPLQQLQALNKRRQRLGKLTSEDGGIWQIFVKDGECTIISVLRIKQ